MNRTGLAIALVVGVAVGVLFGVYPRLDLDISALFYDPHNNLFAVNAQPWVSNSRAVARWLIGLIVAPAFLTLFGKLILPRWRMPIGGRAALFLIVTMALGPGLLANVILKEHWGRSRPIDVTQFSGTDRFSPWWSPRGDCPANCSFIAGEPSGAFWTLGPAALAPPQWRLFAYGAALALGTAVGFLRIASGGHFFSDVMFAGVFVFLLIWATHGLLFRWPSTRTPCEAIGRQAVRAGETMRGAVGTLAQRLGGQLGKPS
jgi:lipid A 4'-phosphatase